MYRFGATDLWFDVSENALRIRDAGVDDGVFPEHADARALPFGDSFIYYGTDDLYLNYLARFVRPGGQVGIAGTGLMQEINGPIPRASPPVVEKDRESRSTL